MMSDRNLFGAETGNRRYGGDADLGRFSPVGLAATVLTDDRLPARWL
jgi:hypothetical protein